MREADAYSLGKVCFPTLCNTCIYAWGQERDWLGGEKGLDVFVSETAKIGSCEGVSFNW